MVMLEEGGQADRLYLLRVSSCGVGCFGCASLLSSRHNHVVAVQILPKDFFRARTVMTSVLDGILVSSCW